MCWAPADSDNWVKRRAMIEETLKGKSALRAFCNCLQVVGDFGRSPNQSALAGSRAKGGEVAFDRVWPLTTF